MKKIICFDVNGTLISGKAWQVLAQGNEKVEEEIGGVFGRYFNNEISVSDAWEGLVSILKREGMSKRDYIYSCCDKPIEFKEGAEDIVSYLKQKGYKIYLISCSIDIHIDCLVKKMGVDGMYAGSHLIFDDNGELVSIETDCVKGRKFKEECLNKLAEKEEVDIKDIIFVGDGGNDLGPFKLTGHGIAMGGYKELIDVSWKQIKKLSEIKEIL